RARIRVEAPGLCDRRASAIRRPRGGGGHRRPRADEGARRADPAPRGDPEPALQDQVIEGIAMNRMDRRTFLRGTGAALALPWLESLAAAAGGEVPRRMVAIETNQG